AGRGGRAGAAPGGPAARGAGRRRRRGAGRGRGGRRGARAVLTPAGAGSPPVTGPSPATPAAPRRIVGSSRTRAARTTVTGGGTWGCWTGSAPRPTCAR
ncbi:hypothetical protein FA014_07650, partial [Cellulomonas hominis]